MQQPATTVVGDRFEIERLAGVGGMGTVYRARDRLTGGAVALKLLHRTGPQEEARFAQEARILSELSHPGIVQYVDHGSDGKQLFLALEWLEGEDLGARLARGSLPIDEALALLHRLAEALAAAHARGVVHRDLKPSNVFLPDGSIGRAKILDFGVARLTAGWTRAGPATRTGLAIGTPAYMAPEQARGDPLVDARADVFSLGCLIYECLTGRPPFAGEHLMATLAKILLEEAPRLRALRPEAPSALDALLAAMLAKDAAARPADAAAVLARASRITGDDAGPVSASGPASELTGGEQRLLSVVLVGAAAAQDPASAPTLIPGEALAGVAGALRDAASAFGGELDVLADGSCLVTLGGGALTPTSRRDTAPLGAGGAAQARTATDQAAQAARCALALRALVARDAPIALATGRAVASGRWPVGEVIDRAAALLRAELDRGPGLRHAVRVDAATAGLLDDRFEIEGEDAPRLVAERPHAEGVRTLLGRPTPFVGRERQLRVLESAYAACATEPEARAVVVTGPAGVGKSRLRAELIRALAARTRDPARSGASTPPDLPAPEVWSARGDPMRAGSPFGLLAAAICGAAGIREGEPLAARQAKLRARVARHVPPAEQARVTEFLAELVGAPFSEDQSAQPVQLRAARGDPQLMGDQLRRAWEDLVLAECAARPLLLVLEDLQWGDLPTIRCVDAALRRAEEAPLLVLALGRPELTELFPRLWSERNVIELRLGELPRKAAERLARQALGEGANDAVIARVVDRAGGNAFFLEELIRAVVAAGRGARGPETVELPETVLAMAQARLDTLEPAVRRVLRAASVFGQVFWRGGAAALLGGEGRAEGALGLGGSLRALAERELIERREGSRFPGQEEYAFRHALLREAAYAALTPEDRALGHRLAGEWLEQVGEADAIALAEHFDRGGEPARAARWFLRGAEQALEGGDLEAALVRAERGAAHERRLKAAGRAPEPLGALLLVQAEARRWRGELDGALRCAEEAARLLPRGSVRWLRAADEIMTASGRRADFALTLAWAEEVAEGGSPRASDPSEQPGAGDVLAAQVIALCSAGRELLHAGRYADADAVIARVLALSGDPDRLDPRAAAEVHRLRGARARQVGDLAADRAGYAAALAAYERAGDERRAENARVSLGFTLIELGDHAGAEAALRAALEAAARMGLRPVATRAQQNLGLVLAAGGRLDEALALTRQVVEEARAQGNQRFEGWTRVYASVIASRAGDFAAAESDARAALDLLRATPPARAGALAALARALRGQGRIDEALSAGREAMEILEQFGGIEEFEPLVRVAFAEAADAAGERDAALRAVRAGRERLEGRAENLDPAWRRSFLEVVPENARLMELSRRWEGEEA